jgi:hypothetical protein
MGFVLFSGLAFAGAVPAPAQSALPAPADQTCSSGTTAVIDVYKEVPQETQRALGGPALPGIKKERTVQLRDTITVEVTGLACLLKNGKADDIVLYLDDRPLSDMAAFPPSDPNQNVLRFTLRRTEASREVWTYVLGKPTWDPRLTKVSIGLRDKYAVPSRSSVLLKVIPHGWFLFWLLLLAVFLIGFFLLARKTDILRDAGASPAGDARRPYSLARTQASFWFFLILASYMLIGMITGDFSTSITGTVLILMGISSGTAVGSAFIDASKTGPDADRLEATARQTVQAELSQVEAAIQSARDTLKTKPNDQVAFQTLSAKNAERREKLSQLHKMSNESEQFLQDILSDTNGVNFHRFQMMAWTVVLGIIFVGHVYKELAMPEFSQTLLSLMGISAGTYLGLKIPEPTVPKT